MPRSGVPVRDPLWHTLGMHPITRRQALVLAGASFAGLATAWGADPEATPAGPASGRLKARPSATKTTITGRQLIGLGGERDAVLQVPADVSGPVPLLVVFHGAGQNAGWTMRFIATFADAAGAAVLAPDSRGRTWDAMTATSAWTSGSSIGRSIGRFSSCRSTPPAS